MFRASTGKRKISTTVSHDALPRFHAQYVAVLKANMTALKKVKKDKKPKPKKGEEAAAGAVAAAGGGT